MAASAAPRRKHHADALHLDENAGDAALRPLGARVPGKASNRAVDFLQGRRKYTHIQNYTPELGEYIYIYIYTQKEQACASLILDSTRSANAKPVDGKNNRLEGLRTLYVREISLPTLPSQWAVSGSPQQSLPQD